MPEEIIIRPIGVVKSDYLDAGTIQEPQQKAVIEVFPKYADALRQIEKNSHLWVLTWFHLARRDRLVVSPYRMNPNSPDYGVFALRTPVRPNPVALILVELHKIEGMSLYVAGLDAVNGTPVIDIKPYYENDIVFSPRTPNIQPSKREMLQDIFFRQAVTHHQEECPSLLMAVRMAVIASERFGNLNSPDLQVTVEGSPCLADTIQGLSRARLANPPRFAYLPADLPGRTVWRRGNETLSITASRRIDMSGFLSLADADFFDTSIQKQ
ncbi:MAG: tRNA (N6-threonylcarbamoyladenosine(37)-N6)-methyltransferase TrmO [Desulfotomaculaceae bacterium]|nr:tRNA (N6-threonylcarbamoyladenosine(37)-N6)-methyltransferase TrmO [Desulfotomaculaceae bacterium]MDD4767222.1 tRNA (N6-threonylcarbamoyladenosine(37)-N6)-methyltransferase TrmO [Desulfotomaculaceae bacterium]